MNTRVATCALVLLSIGGVVQALADAPARPLPPQTGIPAVRNFDPNDYRAGQQNFAVVQDARGVLYVGNADGVLEYDGVRWHLIPTTNRTAVRSIAVDAEGRIWIGAQGEIGYLAPDDSGAMRYVSIMDRIPADARAFEDVWRTFATPRGVYFATYAALIRVDGDGVRVWRPHAEFRLAFLAGDRLFVKDVERGLVELANDELVAVPGGELFAKNKIYTTVPWPDGSVLIGTPSDGLFALDAAGVRSFPTDADEALKKAFVFQALWLADGRLALASLQGGVLLLDRQGHLVGRFDKSSGLQDDNVKAMYQDAHGSLWLALNHGVSRVDVASPLTSFGERAGLAGAVVCACRLGDTLYVGTTQGLFRLATAPGGAPSFVAVPGVESETWDLVSLGDALLVANAQGVYEVRGAGAPVLVRPSSVYACALLQSSRDPARVFVGLQNGLGTMRRTASGWTDEGQVPGATGEIRSVYEEADGHVWLGTTSDGVARLSLPAGWAGGSSAPAPTVENYGVGEGLPGLKYIRIRALAGAPIFATQKGVFRYDDASGRFAPDPRFASLFADAPRWVAGPRVDAGNRLWMYAVDEARGLRDAGAAVPAPDGSYRWQPAPPIATTATDSDLSTWVDADGTVWFGSPADGLFRYDPAVRGAAGWTTPALVRRVVGRGERVLFDGAGTVEAPALDYADNSMRFEFAAPGSATPEANLYQVLLEGNDRDWSPWSAEAYKDYTNLSEGAYRFHVRARDRDGVVSDEGLYAFSVRAPWYRTVWAYLVYALAAGALVFGFAHLRLRALTRRTAELEAKIAERTAELARSEREALEANRAKSVFLANMSHELRTPLNAVIGFAQLMERNRDIPAAERENLAIIQGSGEHLLGLINDVLSISKIEAGKLSLDAKPFDLGRMLDAVESMIRVRAEGKGLALVAEIAPGLPAAVSGDEGKLRQVLLNLLGNAVKFTARGEVTLAARWDEAQGGRATFEVRDTGVGISATELANLFEPFVQTASGREAKEGTGLGLAISRQIARLMDGDITVTSDEGRGTTFRVEVALPRADDASAASSARRVVRIEPGQPVPRILVVDDTRESRALLAGLLKTVGFDVVEAADGAEGVEAWRARRPDLVFMDGRMPVLDGTQATRRIRELEAESDGNRTAIVAVTASAFEHEREEVLAGGADDFITKPYREQTIFETIATCLGVGYVYDEPAAGADPAAGGPAVLTPERFAALPGALVLDLTNALEVGDFVEAAHVADRVADVDPALGAALSTEIRAFHIDELLAVIERAEPL